MQNRPIPFLNDILYPPNCSCYHGNDLFYHSQGSIKEFIGYLAPGSRIRLSFRSYDAEIVQVYIDRHGVLWVA